MFEIIEIDNNSWDEIAYSFENIDIYYLSGYVRGFMQHGDGNPLMLYYNHNGLKSICVVLKRHIPDTDYYDIITPYGYGGFLIEGDSRNDNLENMKKEFYDIMQKNNIISAFFRYHPILKNAEKVISVFPILNLGKTIDIDLTNSGNIFENFTSKNRNMVRKAQKNGVKIYYGKGMELFDKFIPIYNSTMDRDNASGYYYFSREFYESIDTYLKDNYLIFYAEYENKIISISIILFANKYIHYHLSGSIPEYRSLAPSNLLLYEAALWGVENGYKRFHLGGGVGAGEDNLYKFKAGFNKISNNQFSISKIIIDQLKYDELVEKHIKENPDLDLKSQFFPLYRL